jgi:hypothetical protein
LISETHTSRNKTIAQVGRAAWELRERKKRESIRECSQQLGEADLHFKCLKATTIIDDTDLSRRSFVIISPAKRLVLILNVRIRASKNAVYDKRGR